MRCTNGTTYENTILFKKSISSRYVNWRLNSGPIDMNGHSLTMGNNISVTLSGDAYNSDEYVLFTNLGNTGTEDVEFELTVNGQKTTAVYSGNAVVVNAASVREPTSATLSLLALAGLVMRRRRK